MRITSKIGDEVVELSEEESAARAEAWARFRTTHPETAPPLEDCCGSADNYGDNKPLTEQENQ